MQDMIHLQNSHVTQLTNGHLVTDWKVYANGENVTPLMTLPATYTETEVFKIMDFAKQYELTAFNEGAKFGKRKTMEVYQPKLDAAEARINEMIKENERLSTALEQVYMKHVVEI